MSELLPETITVPSELERGDGFLDLAALFGSGLMVWYGTLYGVPLWLMLPLVALIAVWTLTGEPAGDVPYLGAIAAGLRSKLGLRRAHEWGLAYGHYFKIRIGPDWKVKGQRTWSTCGARCSARLSRARSAITAISGSTLETGRRRLSALGFKVWPWGRSSS